MGSSSSPPVATAWSACGNGEQASWLARPSSMEMWSAPPFAPDGRAVFAVDRSGQARLWELATFKPVTPWLQAGGPFWFAMNATFSGDGRFALASCQSSPVPAFDFQDLKEADELDGEDLVKLSELFSGYRLEAGEISGLSSREWMERWSYFRKNVQTFVNSSHKRRQIGTEDRHGLSRTPATMPGLPGISKS